MDWLFDVFFGPWGMHIALLVQVFLSLAVWYSMATRRTNYGQKPRRKRRGGGVDVVIGWMF